MLLPDTYYHIYNRANGWEALFKNDENCRFFLEKCNLYLSPVAKIYAWCLIPNHFHLMIKTKTEEELQTLRKYAEQVPGELSESAVGKHLESLQGTGSANSRDVEGWTGAVFSKQFQKLFSSYSQSFNKVHKRKGSLFIPNFKYKVIEGLNHRIQIALYIHRNPIHHGLVKKPEDCRHSSYNAILESTEEHPEFTELISWFGDKKELIEMQLKYQAEISRDFED